MQGIDFPFYNAQLTIRCETLNGEIRHTVHVTMPPSFICRYDRESDIIENEIICDPIFD